MCMIAQRCRADVQRRRLGRTRTTGFRPLGERMAANRHGMRPRGRSERPLGRHGASRLHVLKIWRASECNAPWWAHRESAALAAWVATLVAAELAAPAAPQTQWRPDARSVARAQARTLRRALSGALRQQSRAITSNQQHSVAPRRRPTPSSSERALLPPLPLTALPSSQPPFPCPRAV